MTAKEKIRSYLCTEVLKGVDENTIRDDKPLIQEGLIDSIGIMKLITFLTEKFKVELNDEDFNMDNFETLNNITTLVAQKS
ncbi:MAG: acyl carrier protein [Candidatus Aminicenantes bacterium]|jgi:acyl carrier protein